MKKIVVLIGSCRDSGNTARLADAFIQGAKEAGNKVTRFNIAKMNIHGCLDCKYCHTHDGVCIQKDDMGQIHDALREADLAVIASPIYYAGLTGQMKSVIDRLFVAKGKAFDNIKEAKLLLTYASETGESIVPCIESTRLAVGYLGWELTDVIQAAGVYNAGEIDGREELDQARKLGVRA
ncbi:flavodoxin family protein [Anaerolentibacter hominis]|uniref:flavodoxin family protein n=1 Tax=Anaerolentibacter hominis TaxID=3079009 RepID=UPI0031B840F9